jgi:hypothetical protein
MYTYNVNKTNQNWIKQKENFEILVVCLVLLPPQRHKICVHLYGYENKTKKQIGCVTLLKFCALLSVRVLRCSYKQLFRTRPSDRARTEWTAKDAGRSVRTETKSKGTFTTHWHDDGFFFQMYAERERGKGLLFNQRRVVNSTHNGSLIARNQWRRKRRKGLKQKLDYVKMPASLVTTTTTTTNNYATTSTR